MPGDTFVRSMMGDQLVSSRVSAPAFGFGSSTRENREKMYYSEEHAKLAVGGRGAEAGERHLRERRCHRDSNTAGVVDLAAGMRTATVRHHLNRLSDFILYTLYITSTGGVGAEGRRDTTSALQPRQ